MWNKQTKKTWAHPWKLVLSLISIMDQVNREEIMFEKEQITYKAEILSQDSFAVLVHFSF